MRSWAGVVDRKVRRLRNRDRSNDRTRLWIGYTSADGGGLLVDRSRGRESQRGITCWGVAAGRAAQRLERLREPRFHELPQLGCCLELWNGIEVLERRGERVRETPDWLCSPAGSEAASVARALNHGLESNWRTLSMRRPKCTRIWGNCRSGLLRTPAARGSNNYWIGKMQKPGTSAVWMHGETSQAQSR